MWSFVNNEFKRLVAALTFLSDLRVARVKFLFNLPRQFGDWPHPLAYIEWFNSIRDREDSTGLYQLTRSDLAFAQQSAAVVSVTQLVRICHLIACTKSPKIDKTWTSSNVLDKGKYFLLNHYFDLDLYSLLNT